ncbi:MAG: hypothetical protein AAFN40_22365 [Cyanobacteria bacterium J06560_6]
MTKVMGALVTFAACHMTYRPHRLGTYRASPVSPPASTLGD